jgi:undecaprenyl-diphosphatase
VSTEVAPDTRPTERTLAITCAVGLGGVGVMAALLRSAVPGPDHWLHRFAVEHRGHDLAWVRTVTQAGSTRIIWPMLVVAALLFPRARNWNRLVTSGAFFVVAAAGIGVRLELSRLVRRARPSTVDWEGTAGGWSFPSGHTMAATLGAGALAWAVTRHLARREARIIVWSGAVLYAVVVGWTRVWLGVHWPLDVVGSWLLGAGWLSGMALLLRAVGPRLGDDTGEP